jgi:hypothetical protein
LGQANRSAAWQGKSDQESGRVELDAGKKWLAVGRNMCRVRRLSVHAAQSSPRRCGNWPMGWACASAKKPAEMVTIEPAARRKLGKLLAFRLLRE